MSSLAAVQVGGHLALVVVMNEIRPQPELCSGLCCADDEWCHQPWDRAGGYYPGVGAHHPLLHIIYQQTQTIPLIFAPGRAALKA